jgi:hypothetical protein
MTSPYRDALNPIVPDVYMTMEVKLPWYRFGRPYKTEMIKQAPYWDINGKLFWQTVKTPIKFCRYWRISTNHGRYYQYQLMNGFFVIFGDLAPPKEDETPREYGEVQLWCGPDFSKLKFLSMVGFSQGRNLLMGVDEKIIKIPFSESHVEILVDHKKISVEPYGTISSRKSEPPSHKLSHELVRLGTGTPKLKSLLKD